MNQNYLVTKSNYFIMNSSYDLSLEEQKIILTLASMVSPEDEDFKTYKFKISDFMDLLNIKDRSKYTEVPKITKELMKKVFEIQEGNTLIQTAWLSGAKYEKGSGMVELTFSGYLKPYLLQLGTLFTRYKLSNILNMKNKYSPRFYELMKANEFKKQGYIEIGIDELRKLLKADDIYPKYNDFKRFVIERSQKELEKLSDIRFDFEEIKTARKVTSLKFIIRANESTYSRPVVISPPKESKDTSSKEKPLESKLEAIRGIVKENITNKQVESLYKASNGDINVISEKYEISKMQKTPIKNIVAWLITAIENDYKADPKMKINIPEKDFTEREYDYDALERKLLGWDK
jgi:plasmid replication initiation protein